MIRKAMNDMDPQDRFVPKEGVITATSSGRLVLLDLRSGEYHSLNEVGTRIWALLEARTRLTDIAQKLADEFEVEHAAALDDVYEFVQMLSAAKFVTRLTG